jgi:hypothetical protein
MTDDDRAKIRDLIREGRNKYGDSFVIMRVVDGRLTPFMKSPEDALEIDAMMRA